DCDRGLGGRQGCAARSAVLGLGPGRWDPHDRVPGTAGDPARRRRGGVGDRLWRLAASLPEGLGSARRSPRPPWLPSDAMFGSTTPTSGRPRARLIVAALAILAVGVWLGGHPSWIPSGIRGAFI